MEQLALSTDQVERRRTELDDAGSRTLRNVIIVDAAILLVGIVLAATAPEPHAAARSASERALDDGARPLPGRRF